MSLKINQIIGPAALLVGLTLAAQIQSNLYSATPSACPVERINDCVFVPGRNLSDRSSDTRQLRLGQHFEVFSSSPILGSGSVQASNATVNANVSDQ